MNLRTNHFFIVLTIVVFSSCNLKKEKANVLYSDVDTTRFEKGDAVFPFAYINLKEKGWKVVVELSGDDLKDLSLKVPGRKLTTGKPSVLKLIKNWKFTYNGGDLSTVTSSILIYKDGTLVDQQGIVLNKKLVGLQSIKYGWIESSNRKEVFKALRLMDEKSF